jgi:hypothetical protein
MEPILAELCGRWGCTAQEGILNVILVTFFQPILAFVGTIILGTIGLAITFVASIFRTPQRKSQDDTFKAVNDDQATSIDAIRKVAQRKAINTGSKFLINRVSKRFGNRDS